MPSDPTSGDTATPTADHALLQRVDDYFHAVPLSGAVAEEVGPFTLFRSTVSWPYYARPRPGRPAPVTSADVERLHARCRELGLAMAVEWVVGTAPELGAAAAAAGLDVTVRPLLVAEAGDVAPVTPPPGVVVDVLPAQAAPLVLARAVAEVAFGDHGGDGAQGGVTGGGQPAGSAARDAQVLEVGAALAESMLARAKDGTTITVGAVAALHGMVASGSHQPVGPCSEIVGVATLPAHQRQGLGAAVSSRLAGDAFDRGATLVLLSARDDAVARVYERIGFRRIGHVGAAST